MSEKSFQSDKGSARFGSGWLWAAAVLLAPALLILAHGVLAERNPEKVCSLDATRSWAPVWRWLWVLAGLLSLLLPGVRTQWMRGLQALSQAASRLPQWAFFGLGGASLFGVFLFFRCQNFFLGDSYHLVHAVGRRVWVHWNEPLDILLHAWTRWCLEHLFQATTAEWSYALWSALAGVVYWLCCLGLGRVLQLSGAGRALVVGAMLTCGGVQLFFGYAESYTLCTLFICLYLWAGLRALGAGGSLVLPAFFLGIAVCLHPLSLSAAPGLIVLWLARVPHRAKSSELAQPQPGKCSLLRRLWALSLGFWGPVLLLIAALHFAGYGLDRVGHTDKPGGGDNRMLVAWSEPSSPYERYTLLSVAHAIDVLNLQIQSSGLAVPLLLLGIGCAWARGRRKPGSQACFLALVSGGMLIFLCLWNPDLGAARDWDLFAAPSFPLTLLGAFLVARHLPDRLLPLAAFSYPFAAAWTTAPWILENSVRSMPPPGWRG